MYNLIYFYRKFATRNIPVLMPSQRISHSGFQKKGLIIKNSQKVNQIIGNGWMKTIFMRYVETSAVI